MNPYLISAAILTVLIGLAHSLMGERFLLPRLFKKLPPSDFGSALFINRTARTAWHLTTLAWWGFAALLVAVADQPLHPGAVQMVQLIALLFLCSAVLSLVLSRGRHLSWIVFLAISLLSWMSLP